MIDYDEEKSKGMIVEFDIKTEKNRLVFKPQFEKRNFDLNEHDKGKLIAVVSGNAGEDKKCIVRITTESICVYSDDKDSIKFKFVLKNTSIKKILLVDDVYMYCLQEGSRGKYLL